jgi:hypothetical protein
MPPVGFEPTILASELPKTHALDRMAHVIHMNLKYFLNRIIGNIVVRKRSIYLHSLIIKISKSCICKRTLRAWIKMLRKPNCLHFSPKSPDCLPDDSGGHIRIDRNTSAASWPVTNCHECAWLSNLENRRQEEARAHIGLLSHGYYYYYKSCITYRLAHDANEGSDRIFYTCTKYSNKLCIIIFDVWQATCNECN